MQSAKFNLQDTLQDKLVSSTDKLQRKKDWKGSNRVKEMLKTEQSVTICGLHLDANPKELLKKQSDIYEKIWTLTGAINFLHVIMVVIFLKNLYFSGSHTEILKRLNDMTSRISLKTRKEAEKNWGMEDTKLAMNWKILKLGTIVIHTIILTAYVYVFNFP